ncbi:MAG: fatty acid desaturase [Candidatus Eisenbacteria bacterium]
MDPNSTAADSGWREVVADYVRPSLRRSLTQIADTILPYFALLVAMYFSLRVSYWITLALALPAAGFLSRAFIIFHDCGHGAFFRSAKANRIVGAFTGLLAFFPSYHWSHEHAKHHAVAGKIGRPPVGDIWTVTVAEYTAMSRWNRFRYRLYRHPLVMFGFGPLFTFLIRYRYWKPGDGPRARRSAIRANLAILGILTAAALTIGLKAYVMIQLPVLAIAATAGIWLFYVQHQFEGTYRASEERWCPVTLALQGSSYYRMPRILQWFTGNIGYHHIHHLSPRIPNYYLEACHEASPLFRAIPPVTLRASLKALSFRLWDEERERLVGFTAVKERLRRRVAQP